MVAAAVPTITQVPAPALAECITERGEKLQIIRTNRKGTLRIKQLGAVNARVDRHFQNAYKPLLRRNVPTENKPPLIYHIPSIIVQLIAKLLITFFFPLVFQVFCDL